MLERKEYSMFLAVEEERREGREEGREGGREVRKLGRVDT